MWDHSETQWASSMQAKATGGSWSAGGRQPLLDPPPPTSASGERSNTHTSPDFTWGERRSSTEREGERERDEERERNESKRERKRNIERDSHRERHSSTEGDKQRQ